MAIPLYLAMTASEFSQCQDFPAYTAWMDCQFSPNGSGLSSLPSQLPKGALLILNDRTPVQGHDPKQIRQTLAETVSSLNCCAVLLDMQRPDCCETRKIIQELLALPCPVCVSDIYAKSLECPVFLPPVPLTCTPDAYFSPWKGREIWLDVAVQSSVYTVTERGCQNFNCEATGDYPFTDEHLYCHYRLELEKDSAKFYIQRTKADIANLLEHSSVYGVRAAVGLWQELI